MKLADVLDVLRALEREGVPNAVRPQDRVDAAREGEAMRQRAAERSEAARAEGR